MRGFLRFFTLTVLCSIIYSASFAQLKKAELYYSNLRFKEAIPFYSKAFKKSISDSSAFLNYARSYKAISDFENATLIYKRLIDVGYSNPIALFEYAELLKTQGNYTQAKEYFFTYLQRVKVDENELAEMMIESCSIDMKRDSLLNCKVYPIERINSEFSEFSPIVKDSIFYFVSDRQENLIDNDKNNWNSNAYSSVFRSKMNDESFKNPKLVSKKINKSGHNGPMCIDPITGDIYFTHIDNKNNSKSVNKARLLILSKEGKMSEFKYNNPDFSIGHPTISPDGQSLFFTSDMPGGVGGKDIYVCKKSGTEWGNPINLGESVNTVRDELFPYTKNGKILYFSSNGHRGYGGMDIFSATLDGNEWKFKTNLKMPINSSKDDFGIFFTNENQGFLSSNRKGGKGGDDIYSFSITPYFLSGTIYSTDSNTPAAGIKLYLLNKLGQVLDSIYTDDVGAFVFWNLNPMEVSLVKIDGEDVVLKGRLKANFPHLNSMKVTLNSILAVDTLTLDSEGFFRYEKLAEHRDFLKLKNAIDIEGNVFFQYKELKAINNTLVLLLDKDGNILAKVYSDENGFFSFKKLPPGVEYTIMLDEKDPGFNPSLKYVIFGEVLSSLEHLPVDKTTLYLGNVADTRLLEGVTNRLGKYKFEYLPAEHFDFKLLNVVDKIKAEDVWKEVKETKRDTIIMQNIYYNYGSAEILPEAKLVLNNLVAFMNRNSNAFIEIFAHTDSRGSAEGNLILSQKRAESVVAYVSKFGITRDRVKGSGYGESRPLNKCTDDVNCSEEEHKLNRRTEFNLKWR